MLFLPISEFQYASEKIPWMYKNIRTVLSLYLIMLLHLTKRKVYDRVDIIICIDHGKGHFRGILRRWSSPLQLVCADST